MPTDRTRFDWNNTGVHRAGRNVHLDSDCRMLAEMQLKWKPATQRNQLLLFYFFFLLQFVEENVHIITNMDHILYTETQTQEFKIRVSKNKHNLAHPKHVFLH